MAENNSNQVVITVALAEFNALRNEIIGRSSSAYTLLNINITATATVAGFVLSNKADSRLLLILPLLSPALGLLFLDHSYNIKNLGGYINTQIRPIILEYADHSESRLLNYENFVDRYERNILLRFLPMGIPLILLFIGFPFAAWIFLISIVRQPWEQFLLGIGLITMVSYLVLWVRFMIQPLGQSLRR
ncbi:hypothetical protein [Crocosphaera sp. XPORK-15E]|uniref:hypothetical protein n=1 Tax=Crocosphaera sp. XPORK-15E TaxID=3110247 RepID=UPI002B1F8CF1|nr:hypothetical protein [Crocosphaera sp. XPORK-15E]MEA5537054.1 hypothetical protein [Crocosphaera sp. XPORK-15E]